MFCGFCGEKLNKSDKFCLNCGEATSQSKPVEAEKPAKGPYSAAKDEVIEDESLGEESDKQPLFGFLRSSRFWKVIGFATVIGLIFIPSAIYLTSKPNSENQIVVAATPEPTSASPAPTQSKIQNPQIHQLQKLLSHLKLKLKQCFVEQSFSLAKRSNVLN